MKFRLLKKSEHSLYSERFKDFEEQFTYPLGDKFFKIKHGSSTKSYFDFFDNLGEPRVFVLENNEKVLGVGCAILRKVDNQKFWYLCDFKLDKTVRGKGALSRLAIKYVMPFYLKSKNMVAVNMSPPKNNWMAKKINYILFFLKLKEKPMYFYEWTYSEYKEVIKENPSYFLTVGLYTNSGNKDITIDSEIVPIIHIVNKDYARTNLPHFNPIINNKALADLDEKAIFMLATTNADIKLRNNNNEPFNPNSIGTIIYSKKINNSATKLSSIEI